MIPSSTPGRRGKSAVVGFCLALTCLAAAEDVEVKLVVEETQIPNALRMLTSGKPGEHRNVYFLETGNLELSGKGIILRLRETPGKRDESTVKLRGGEVADLPNAEFPVLDGNGEESKVENDKVIGGRDARSFSITAKQQKGEIAELRDGQRKLQELLSKQQEKFLTKYAKQVDWRNARLLGPVKTEKWKLSPDGFRHELVAELWLLPGCEPEQMLEFSTKVDESDAAAAERDLLQLMRKKEIELARSPESKTQAVLKCLLKKSAP